MNKNSELLSYFSLLVIGDNPDEKVFKYDMMDDSDKSYIIYEYKDVPVLRKNRIFFYEEFKKKTVDKKIIDTINKQLNKLKSQTDIDYYTELGEYYTYDEHMNIISNENPKGKWITCDKGGKLFNSYLKDFNGNNITSGLKKNIDWNNIHLNENKVNLYSRTWDLCVNKIKPENDKDKQIISNMKLYTPYFKQFKNKEEYTKYSCSFWTYAIIVNNEWFDMEEINEYSWITNFYDKYIKDLSDDTLITIYECTK